MVEPSNTGVLGEKVAPLIELCRPLKIRVTVRRLKDKYFIHFDGTKTYADPADWNKFWTSFLDYISFLLSTNGFKGATLKVKHETHVVAFVGTLFDFLKNVQDTDGDI
jgi:hypothetical protein